MIGPVILDSNILVDHFNGIAQARDELKYHRDAVISAVTWMELMTAFEAKLLAGVLSEADYAAAKTVLSLFPVVHINDAIMEETARVRGQSLFIKKKLALPDAIIQASAIVTTRILVTRNIKDFDMYASNVRVPYLAEITSRSKPPTVSLFTPVSDLAVVITYVALPP